MQKPLQVNKPETMAAEDKSIILVTGGKHPFLHRYTGFFSVPSSNEMIEQVTQVSDSSS